MVAANRDFIDSIDTMLEKVAELEAALEALPRDVTIRISYEEIGRPDVLTNETVTRTVRDINIGTAGMAPENLPPVTQNIRENVTESFGDLGAQMSHIDAQSAALRELDSQLAEGAITAREYAAATREVVAAQFMEANMAARTANAVKEQAAPLAEAAAEADTLAASWRRVGGSGRDMSASMIQLISEVNATSGAQQRMFAVDAAGAAEVQKLSRAQQESAMTAGELDAAIKANTPDVAQFSTVMAGAAAALARANAVLLPFRAAADNAGGGMAALAAAAAAARIPLGLAAFGITGWGTAIHLVIMAVVEFLAVFLPAMYAAVAGAYAMAQGMQQVTHMVTGLYTASETLGPMVGKTAGDMLGLGHSMQVAQDRANPGVYELFGEALKAIGTQSHAGADGLSNFARVGLEVTHMLDAFGAKVVADLQGPMGATLQKLVGQAVQDLREFGQILGNVGHALLMFAAAMPGAAELALHIATAISEVIKWISQLPAPLLYAVFIFEEMYRWSGILVGGFGLLGRAIALLGTLGIPVFAKIGANVAAMVANVVSGLAGMIANLGGVAAKMASGMGFTKAADGIGMAASGVVGKLGAVSKFLLGPWGAALAVGALALAGLGFWLGREKTATQEFIDGINKAVGAASNMSALNVIAQKNAQVVQQQNQQWASFNALVKAGAGYLALSSGAISGSAQNIMELTAEQKKLFDTSKNVIQGATDISKAYKVDFVTALGLADMAGIKLSTSMGKNGQLNAQAAIQVASLVLGYQKMDQTGGILANTMAAVNIQAGLQTTKVQQTNQAWDQFIAMGTSLTGTFTQLNLDLQQMGNLAPAVGGKIRAFSGQVGSSVKDIAKELTSFSGSSAQVWQSYNQSITQANSFTDALRVAAAAGVVTQKQYGQGIASVVQQLEPYASKSKAALAELMMISQEASGPAYDSTKSLTQNYQALKEWTDKNAVSSGKFAGLLTDLTAKITNVSKVAANFAGTLQSDVLDAMAAAGADTKKITTLTQAYTAALLQNGTQSPATKAAQDALTKALEQYKFKASDVNQIEQILSNTYGRNQAASNTLEGQTVKTRGAFERFSAQLGINKSKADQLWNDFAGKGINTFNILRSHTDLSKKKFEELAAQLHVSKQHADDLWNALHRLPPRTNVVIHETGLGKWSVSGPTSRTGAAHGPQNIGAAPGGFQHGMKVPGGYGGGDIFHALLEPGEAVVPKHLVKAIEPFLAAHKVPGFAAGGVT